MNSSALPRNSFLVGVVLALINFVTVIARLYVADSRSLTDVLWAEDGLFPTCVVNLGIFECVRQPFAGYYLFLPRLASIVIAQAPAEQWPLFSIIAAAVFTALSAFIVFLVLEMAGFCRRTSVMASLVLAMSPLFGIEVIGVVASAYVPLLVASAVVVTLLKPRRRDLVWTCGLLVMTALTMPSAAVLLAVVSVRILARDVTAKSAAAWLGSLGLGLAVQLVTYAAAPGNRSLVVSVPAMRNWADGVVGAIMSAVPGLAWSENQLTPLFVLRAPWYGAWLLAGVLVAVGVAATIRGVRHVGLKSRLSLQFGLLVLEGAGLSLFASLTGTFSYRYLVASFALWVIGLLVMSEPRLVAMSIWRFSIVLVLVTLLWAPAFPASDVRASPAPSWSRELSTVKDLCATGRQGGVPVSFTPVWPDSRSDLTIPQPVISCDIFNLDERF